VPVCSPASARDDALARAQLSECCEVLHFDPATLDRLDDKAAFCATAAELGLPVPDAHRITDPGQALDFDFAAGDSPYILKSIAYDPIRRLDLTRLPGRDLKHARAFIARLPISEDNPWVMQSFVTGKEYCTHSTVRDGQVQLHCCCESSASQLNYAMVDVPEIEAWVSGSSARCGSPVRCRSTSSAVRTACTTRSNATRGRTRRSRCSTTIPTSPARSSTAALRR